MREPIVTWLLKDPTLRSIQGYWNRQRSTFVMVAWERGGPFGRAQLRGMGEGQSLEEAAAGCCNNMMARTEEDAETAEQTGR